MVYSAVIIEINGLHKRVHMERDCIPALKISSLITWLSSEITKHLFLIKYPTNDVMHALQGI